jgi:hypothetical protein
MLVFPDTAQLTRQLIGRVYPVIKVGSQWSLRNKDRLCSGGHSATSPETNRRASKSDRHPYQRQARLNPNTEDLYGVAA